jgi:hypothetical protein
MARWRNRLLLVAMESTYGTAATTAGADALKLSELDVTPLEVELIDRELITGFYGNTEKVRGARMSRATFSVELAGSGTAATPPRFGRLLRACGFSETATTSVLYAPISATFESVTLAFYADGIRHTIRGARGTCGLSLNAKQIPKLNFEMTGLYTASAAETNPTAVFGGQANPVVVSSVNTTPVSVHGYAACVESLELNLANEVVHRDLAGCAERVELTDRKPEGTVVIERPTLAQKDYFDAVDSQATGVLSFQHGQTAGNICTVNMPAINLGTPAYSDSDGVLMLSMPFMPNPVSGNDEITLTFS